MEEIVRREARGALLVEGADERTVPVAVVGIGPDDKRHMQLLMTVRRADIG